jgi:hypothetical protein
MRFFVAAGLLNFILLQAITLVGVLVGSYFGNLRADEPSWLTEKSQVADVLPETVALFGETKSFGEIWNSPLRDKLIATDIFNKIWESPDVMNLRNGIRLAEVTLGEKLPEVLTRISSGGATIAVDRATRGVAVFLVGKDSATQTEFVTKINKLAANLQGLEENELPSQQYRGIKAYKLPQGGFAQLGKWIVIVNQGELGKAIIDRYLEGPNESLSADSRFKDAQSQNGNLSSASSNSSASRLAWGYADIPALKEEGVGKELFQEKRSNFFAELLLGGILTTLRETPYAAATLDADSSTVGLKLSTPFDTSWVDGTQEFYFGPKASGSASPAITLPNQLATLTTYRNISLMWLQAGDLFDEKVNDQLAQAETTLTTLFSGRDFAEEILGAIHPEIRMVSIPPKFADGEPVPTVQIPPFALIARLKNPTVMRKELKRIFQSLIGFINITGAMNGQPQFDQEMKTVDGAEFVTARYVWDESKNTNKEVPVAYNFTPCLAIIDDQLVLSTTENLAEELISALKSPVPEGSVKDNSAGTHRNTFMTISADSLAATLRPNRGQMIAQNMLEKGHSREEAEKETDLLFDLINLFSNVTLDFTTDNTARIDVRANLK